MEEVKVEKVENKFLTFKEVEELHVILDKIGIEGLNNESVSEALVAIALISEAYNSFENKVKAINEKMPIKLKDYNKDPEKEYSEKEIQTINRYYNSWTEYFAKAKEIIYNSNSEVLISDVKVLSKESIISWIKANKKELKANHTVIIYKHMLKV